jgi:hypothetical protein
MFPSEQTFVTISEKKNSVSETAVYGAAIQNDINLTHSLGDKVLVKRMFPSKQTFNNNTKKKLSIKNCSLWCCNTKRHKI